MQIYFKLWVLFFILLIPSLSSKEYVVLTGREDAGMFSIMNDVLALFKEYDSDSYNGIAIDFGRRGYYYDSSKGDNWWTYYFEPIRVGRRKNVHHYPHLVAVWGDEDFGSQEFCNDSFEVFSKYAHLLPEVANQINSFYLENMQGWFMIGVHYRGTDKIGEAPRTPYEKVKGYIDYALNRYRDKNCKIFIATDESQFVDYISALYSNVCFVKEATRSSDISTPVHLNSSNPARVGEEALIDCFLLSKCNYFIKSESNMSSWVPILNPNIEWIQVK